MAIPHAKYLKDYTPPAYFVDTIDLHIELYETYAHVNSFLRIRRNPDSTAENDLVLDGKEMELISVLGDNAVLMESEYEVNDETLTIRQVPDAFTLEITTRIKPQENTSLDGLYKSGPMFCTQCEAQGFRKITYFPDRPDVMSKFTCTIVADSDKYPVLLSNGNPVESGKVDDKRHYAKWEDPFKKPSYLFALVAGDLVCIEDSYTTVSGRKIALRLFVESMNSDKCGHAMESLKKAMKWDEDLYKREYDLDIYMIVAVNDFNMGAMENKGLNVFNSKYVLAAPETATDTDYDDIERVIAHEYFHNWSGNRVTLNSWFQLSLKEGLTVFRDQEFSADMTSRGVKRVNDVRVLRDRQFSEDAGPMAHPVMPASYIEMNNFYTATVYDKGAEVIRMIQTIIGKENFFKGMDLYFDRFDGMAVTTEDFVTVMEDASGKDLSTFRLWYTQAGTPRVKAVINHDPKEKTCSLTLTQNCPATPGQPEKKPMHIPVATGLLDKNGKELLLCLEGEDESPVTTKVLNLDRETQTFKFLNVPEKPLASLVRNFSAPVILEVEYSDDDLIFLMANDADKFNRWDAGRRLFSKTILSLVDGMRNGQKPSLESSVIAAFRKVLTDDSPDKSFLALTLTLPSESELGEQMAVVDVDAIHEIRRFMVKTIARELEVDFLKIYNDNKDDTYSATADAKARRKMKNLALSYLANHESGAHISLAYDQFKNADNMTDEIASFVILSNIDCPENKMAVNGFYEKWKKDVLVLDKWFAIQATSSLPDTLDTVKKLMNHADFSIKNPNKIRSLIGAFCGANPFCFHGMDGRGYEFLADCVISLNSTNPQIASRLASLFNRWKKYDDKRGTMMKTQVERIKNSPGLSSDVYEIVTKALV